MLAGKPSRMESLIKCPPPPGFKVNTSGSRKSHMRKDDIGKLARIMEILSDIFCEVSHLKTSVGLRDVLTPL